MSALWDMWKLYNPYFWTIDDNEETIEEEAKPKKKRKKSKRRPATKVPEAPSSSGIQLDLAPVILEELQNEAQEKDLTINQLIEHILEAHLQLKAEPTAEQESWQCDFCETQKKFTDYFEFSNHFFAEHMQPDLQKLSEANSNSY